MDENASETYSIPSRQTWIRYKNQTGHYCMQEMSEGAILHASSPASNESHPKKIQRTMIKNVFNSPSRIRVYPRKMRFANSLRQGLQPTLWFPLLRVIAPDLHAPVDIENRYYNASILFDRNFLQFGFPISRFDRPEQRHDYVLSCPSWPRNN